MKNIIPSIFILPLLLATASASFAQTQEDLTPSQKKQLTRVTEPITMFKGFLRIDLTTQFFTNERSFDDNGKRQLPTQNQSSQGQSLSLALNYGVSNRFELNALLPYQSRNTYQKAQLLIPYQNIFQKSRVEIKARGLADLGIGANYQLIPAKGSRPAFTLLAMGFIPVSTPDITNVTDDGSGNLSYDAPVTTGEYSLLSAVRMKRIAYPLSYELEIGMRKYFGASRIAAPGEPRTDFTSGNDYYVRPFINFHLNQYVLITNYFDYLLQKQDTFTGGNSAYQLKSDTQFFRYYPGISIQLKQFRLEQSVMVPLAGQNSGADPSYLFSVSRIF